MSKPPVILALCIVALVVGLRLLGGPPRPDTIPITTRSASARVNFLEGRALYEQIRFDEARVAMLKAVEEDPRFALAHLYLSRTQTGIREAGNSLARAVSLVEEVSDGERLMIVADRAGRFQQRTLRREHLEKLVTAYPKDHRAHWELAVYHFRQKSWDSAVSANMRVIDLSPDFPSVYNLLGYCHRFLGNLRTAEECFLRYMELIPDAPNPYDSYADLLTEMNRHREAIQFYQTALEVQPDYAASHLGIANNLCVLGRHDEAREQLQRLLGVARTDAQRRAALQGVAMSYLDQGDFESAFQGFEAAHQIAIAEADSVSMAQDLDAMGQMWLEIGQPQKASTAFTAALNLTLAAARAPSVIEQAQLDHSQRLALVWLHRNNLAQARALALQYQIEAERTGDRTRMQMAHQTLGLIALKSGDPGLAVKELSESDLEMAYNQYHLALAREASGDLPQALRLYIKASNYDQFDRLGQAFVRRKALSQVESLRLAQQPVAAIPSP